MRVSAAAEATSQGLDTFLGEILWREFSAYLLFHNPHMPERPLRLSFADLPFRNAPAELEAVLHSHPAVADAAVVPVADEWAGEVPKAFVVAAREVTADELIDYVAARVAPHKRVREVAFIDAIPTSPSGKTLRRLLV